MANDKKNDTTELTTLMNQLPPEIEGWKRAEKIEIYNPENLYQYINGGAELFISYQFKHLAAHTYTQENQPEIKVDVFDMGQSWGAFGVFAQSRETVDNFLAPDIESEYAAGLLTFWKDKYYISILAYPETPQSKETVKTLAQRLARAVPNNGTKPEIVNRLPTQNMLPQSLRYFRHHMWVNSEFFISEQDILMIRDGAEAALARYHSDDPDKKKALLLLVQYPDALRAQEAAQSFGKLYLHSTTENVKQMEDKRWTGYRIQGNTLILLFNLHQKQAWHTLVNQVK